MSDITLNNNFSSLEMASRYGQYSYNLYDLSSGEDQYLMPTNVAETTPVRSNCAAGLLIAARLYLNSPPELAQNCGQINPNPNDYDSDLMEISSSFGYLISLPGGNSKKKRTQSTLISPMRNAKYCVSYLTVSVWRLVFPFREM
jgi:ankyrin repeat protein